MTGSVLFNYMFSQLVDSFQYVVLFHIVPVVNVSCLLSKNEKNKKFVNRKKSAK